MAFVDQNPTILSAGETVLLYSDDTISAQAMPNSSQPDIILKTVAIASNTYTSIMAICDFYFDININSGLGSEVDFAARIGSTSKSGRITGNTSFSERKYATLRVNVALTGGGNIQAYIPSGSVSMAGGTVSCHALYVYGII